MSFMVLTSKVFATLVFFSKFGRFAEVGFTQLTCLFLQNAFSTGLDGSPYSCVGLSFLNNYSNSHEKHRTDNLNKLKNSMSIESFSIMASDSKGTSKSLVSSDRDDEILVLYDKRYDRPKEKFRTEDKRSENWADKYVVCLDDIPLPPQSWISQLKIKKHDSIGGVSESCSQSKDNSTISFAVPSPYLKVASHEGEGSGSNRKSASNFLSDDFSKEVESMRQKVGEFRKWEFMKNVKAQDHTVGNQNKGIFTVMSYNILAQELLESHQYLYRKHDHRALSWNYRMSILFREIQDASPDVLCLQEVQHSHLDLLTKRLKDLGYSLGLYKQRTNGKVDGCALFYKNRKFKLIESTSVEYYQNYEPESCLLDRDNVAIIARLQLRGMQDGEYQVVVATTHLLYNPRRHDIKLAQTQVLLAELDRLAFIGFDVVKNEAKYWPVIVTGDFNLKPDSAVYHFLTEGFLQYSELAAKSLSVPTYGQAHQDILLPPALHISSKSQHTDLLRIRDWLKHPSESRAKKELECVKIFNSDHHRSFNHFARGLFRAESNPNEWEKGHVSHSFNLKSVYSHQVAQNGKRMQFEATTFQNEWVTVDYIFYSKKSNDPHLYHKTRGSLKLLSRYTLPTRDLCHKLQHLPNLICGSDHLPLMAQFLLTSD